MVPLSCTLRICLLRPREMRHRRRCHQAHRFCLMPCCCWWCCCCRRCCWRSTFCCSRYCCRRCSCYCSCRCSCCCLYFTAIIIFECDSVIQTFLSYCCLLREYGKLIHHEIACKIHPAFKKGTLAWKGRESTIDRMFLQVLHFRCFSVCLYCLLLFSFASQSMRVLIR